MSNGTHPVFDPASRYSQFRKGMSPAVKMDGYWRWLAHKQKLKDEELAASEKMYYFEVPGVVEGYVSAQNEEEARKWAVRTARNDCEAHVWVNPEDVLVREATKEELHPPS